MCELLSAMDAQTRFGAVEDRAAITKLRRRNAALLIAFLGFEQMVFSGGVRGLSRDGAAVLAGGCFFALLGMSWELAMRSGDEYRRALLQRSLLWGMGFTMGLTCFTGFLELAMETSFHVPLLAVPVCLAATTTAAKVVLFRREREVMRAAAR